MNSLKNYPDILEVKDVQDILRIGRRQAYELVHSGQFKSVKVGKNIKISKSVFMTWIANSGNKKRLDGANYTILQLEEICESLSEQQANIFLQIAKLIKDKNINLNERQIDLLLQVAENFSKKHDDYNENSDI